jgi:pyruvate-formate lyase-activating enzyme
MLYEKTDGNHIRCSLCAHRCRIKPSDRGICGVRENRDGTLFSLVYGRVIAENVDPIEKKPLFHVLPGSKSFSIATVGCNFRCTFCQNHDISQTPRETGSISGRESTPEEMVEKARKTGSKTIAYTYTEPTIYFEFAYDTAKMAHEKGLKNVFVTNGFMTEEAIEAISPYLHAANVDLKAFSDDFYRKHCGARLQPVLDSLKKMKSLGIWVEVTTLLIPTLNDSNEELRRRIYSFSRRRDPLAYQPVSSPLPDGRPPPYPGRLHSQGRRNRKGRRPEIRLQRQHPRRRRGKYLLLPLQRTAHRPLWILYRKNQPERDTLPPLRNPSERDILIRNSPNPDPPRRKTGKGCRGLSPAIVQAPECPPVRGR